MQVLVNTICIDYDMNTPPFFLNNNQRVLLAFRIAAYSFQFTKFAFSSLFRVLPVCTDCWFLWFNFFFFCLPEFFLSADPFRIPLPSDLTFIQDVSIPLDFKSLGSLLNTSSAYSCWIVRRHGPKHMLEIIATQGVRECIWVIRGR